MKKTILIADDDEREVEIMTNILSPEYNIVSAEDGIEIIEKLDESGIEAIDGAVLDQQMILYGDMRPRRLGKKISDFNGSGIAKELRQRGFEGPIVIKSTIATSPSLVYKVSTLDVHLHEKGREDDQEILGYLNDKLE